MLKLLKRIMFPLIGASFAFGMTATASSTESITPNIKFNLHSNLSFFSAKKLNVSGQGLVGVDATGMFFKLTQSELPTAVDHVTINKSIDKAYVSLRMDVGDDGINYGEFVKATNCAIYEVDISSLQSKCLTKNLRLLDLSDAQGDLHHASNQPIQFDSTGNVYFLAENFSLDSYPVGAEHALYKFNAQHGSVQKLTDITNILWFNVGKNDLVSLESFNGKQGFIRYVLNDHQLEKLSETFDKELTLAEQQLRTLSSDTLPKLHLNNKLYSRVSSNNGDSVTVIDLLTKQSSIIHLDRANVHITDWSIQNGELYFILTDKQHRIFHGVIDSTTQQAYSNLISTFDSQSDWH